MVPFLCNSFKEILTSLLQMFFLNDTIKKVDATLKLMKIDTNDVNLHKPYDLIQIGTAAKLDVANYKKSTGFNESTVQRFYKEVCMLLASLTRHFIEKSPLKHLIVRCSSCFNQIVLADTNKHEVSKKQFGQVMEKLVATGRFKSKEADDAKDQYEKMLEELVPKWREEFAILIFANQSGNCLVSLRIIHNHLTSKKVTASSITITSDIKSVRSARLRYDQFQLETLKGQKATAKQLKRKIVTNELKQVKQKKISLQESVCELVKDAEEKNDSKLLSISNDLRKLANCKRTVIADLDKLPNNINLLMESII